MRAYTRIVVLLSALLLVSCGDWLDLKPEEQATEEQIFSKGDGYRSVLNGLYKSMATTGMYGRELTFGMLDCMSQQYDLTALMEDKKYLAAGVFDYRSTDLNPTVTQVWKKGFNMIANANHLIQSLQTASPDLFEMGETERRMMLGEAYACRAYMHFDLLRLFAPAPGSGDRGAYVPYVETYPDIMPVTVDLDTYLGKVIADLNRARELTAEFDTTAVGLCLLENNKSRFNNVLNNWNGAYNEAIAMDDFFKGRGYRMHYYAVTALLARVYLYAEKYTEALQAAQEVTGAMAGTSRLFSDGTYTSWWFGTPDLKTATNLKVPSNLIFALYNEKAYEEFGLGSFFTENSTNVTNKAFFVINAENQKLFWLGDQDESLSDPRWSALTFKVDGVYPVSAKYYCSPTEMYREQNVTLIPMIRSSEMAYIIAECHARQGNWAEARTQLTNVRNARNYMLMFNEIKVDGWDTFVRELIREARREWIGEGQLFFLYKRLNAEVDFGRNIVRRLTKSECVLPVPDDQTL